MRLTIFAVTLFVFLSSFAAQTSYATSPCDPRPNIIRSAHMTPGGLSVSLQGATNANTPTNPMTTIKFTSFDNAKVLIGNEVIDSPRTINVPNAITFTIQQVTFGNASTVSLQAVDSCGDYPLFFGGGTGAGWPANPVNSTFPKILSANEKIHLSGTYYISGDIKIDGKKLYDNDSHTGLLIKFNGYGEVSTQYGGFIEAAPSDFANAQEKLNNFLTKGCGQGCQSVTVLDWPGEIPENVLPDYETGSLQAGEKRVLPAGTVITADVKVNGQEAYSGNHMIGTIVTLTSAAEVEAPWGANFFTTLASEVANLANKIAEDMKLNGCGSSCDSVIIRNF